MSLPTGSCRSTISLHGRRKQLRDSCGGCEEILSWRFACGAHGWTDGYGREDDEDMPLTDESDSDDETGGPAVDDDEFEVFKVLEGVIDAFCSRSPGPVWCEPESLEGVVFV